MTGLFISIGIFILTLMLGIPVGICLGLTGLFGVMALGAPMEVVAQRIFTGLDSFPLMCIPFFIIAGEIMNHSQITDRIVNFADLLVGRFRGAMAQANVVASMFFGGITGSAAADVAALGSILIPAMKKNGYDAPFSAAITAASSLQGPIIPPSILAVIYGATMGESIGALFAAGIPIGIMIGLSDMVIVQVLAVRRNYPKKIIKVNFREFMGIFGNASIALIMPLIILGGILTGVFTPTEAAAVAVGYAFIVGIFVLKTLNFKDIPRILVSSGITTGVVFLLLATAQLYSWVLNTNQVPTLISSTILSLTTNPYLVILLINIILLMVGCVMDPGAAIIMLAPVLAPLAIKVGVHPIQFGLIMIVNLCLGLITPPVGLCLFLSANLAKISIERVTRAVMPMFLLNLVVLAVISYWQGFVLWFPRMFGFVR
jgi:C4-dicarboxylate transporter DctM subunit